MFHLTKWYADAVSAEGAFLVGYSAQLRCAGLLVHYSSVLDADGQRHSLRPSNIAVTDSEIRWRAPSLGIDARWQRSADAIRKTIYRNEEGAVEWECLTCGAGTEPAHFHASSGEPAPLGYVECLRLTIAPWRLPIRSLRWGRFLSARNALIWIDWQGDVNSRTIFLNGAPVSVGEINDDGLSLADGARLSLDRGLVIRSGALGGTVFGAVPGLDRIAPARIFNLRECKWRSRASLERPGEPADAGWCIHEVVTWP